MNLNSVHVNAEDNDVKKVADFGAAKSCVVIPENDSAFQIIFRVVALELQFIRAAKIKTSEKNLHFPP